MSTSSYFHRCAAEHDSVENVKGALRKLIGRDIAKTGLQKAVASFRFVGGALARHFERMMALEERGGYMSVIEDAKPDLHQRTSEMRREHEGFRESLARIMPIVEAMPGTDSRRFTSLCGEMLTLLDQIDEHEAKESALLFDAFCSDEGGEG